MPNESVQDALYVRVGYAAGRVMELQALPPQRLIEGEPRLVAISAARSHGPLYGPVARPIRYAMYIRHSKRNPP